MRLTEQNPKTVAPQQLHAQGCSLSLAGGGGGAGNDVAVMQAGIPTAALSLLIAAHRHSLAGGVGGARDEEAGASAGKEEAQASGATAGR